MEQSKKQALHHQWPLDQPEPLLGDWSQSSPPYLYLQPRLHGLPLRKLRNFLVVKIPHNTAQCPSLGSHDNHLSPLSLLSLTAGSELVIPNGSAFIQLRKKYSLRRISFYSAVPELFSIRNDQV